MPETEAAVQELDWIDQLLQKPLPAISGTSAILLRLMTQSTLPFQKMSDYFRNDPVLALSLLNKANLRTHSEESLVKTLSQAISLLGTDFLQEFLATSPAPEPPTTPAVQTYYRTMASSFFAAHLAQHIALQKHRVRAEEFYWSALFFGLPFWFLWRYTPKKMQAWWDRLQHSSSYRKQMETKVFGAPFLEVWLRIQQGYSLPDAVTHNPMFGSYADARQLVKMAAFCPDRGRPILPTDRELLLFLNHPGFIVGISNLIAFHSQRDLYSPLVMRLLRCLSVYREKPLADTIVTVHRIAVESARLHPLAYGAALPAQLIRGPEIPEPDTEASPSAKKTVAPAHQSTVKKTAPADLPDQPLAKTGTGEEDAAAPPIPPSNDEPDSNSKAAGLDRQPDNRQMRQGNKQLYIDLTQSMLRTPARFKDIGTLMNGAARCITYGVGLRTCVVALINSNRTRLKGFYAAGTNDRPNLARLDLDLSKPSLFSKIMEKPSGIWVRPDTSDKVKKMIPNEFRELNQTTDFFVTSCFVKSRPVALIYADAGVDALGLTDYEYECFKHVCNATSQVLHYLINSKNQSKGH